MKFNICDIKHFRLDISYYKEKHDSIHLTFKPTKFQRLTNDKYI